MDSFAKNRTVQEENYPLIPVNKELLAEVLRSINPSFKFVYAQTEPKFEVFPTFHNPATKP